MFKNEDISQDTVKFLRIIIYFLLVTLLVFKHVDAYKLKQELQSSKITIENLIDDNNQMIKDIRELETENTVLKTLLEND